jgi:regulatory protein
MRARLVALGYRPALVETTVARLEALGYLDDERFAAAWIASRDRSHPRGSSALRRELQRKGIDPAIIERALGERDAAPAATDGSAGMDDSEGSDEAGPADLAAATHLLQRRASALAREPDPRKRRRKAYALLARNGFDPEVCARLAAQLGT